MFSFIRWLYEKQIAEDHERLIANHVQEVQNLYLTMRGWRHDYHNHLQTIKALLAMDDYDKAGEYLNQLEQDLDTISLKYKTGNIELDAILNSKLSLAESYHIAINCTAAVPESLTVRTIDLCVVIGNLLDNAIESCEKLPAAGDRFIRVYIGTLKQQLYICCTNATTELVRRLDSQYISSKRGNHGHGLKRIDAVVKKYDGYINRKNEPGVFSTEILFPL